MYLSGGGGGATGTRNPLFYRWLDDESQFRLAEVPYLWKRHFRKRWRDDDRGEEKKKRDGEIRGRGRATQLAEGTERRMRSDREKDYPSDRETKNHAATTRVYTYPSNFSPTY